MAQTLVGPSSLTTRPDAQRSSTRTLSSKPLTVWARSAFLLEWTYRAIGEHVKELHP